MYLMLSILARLVWFEKFIVMASRSGVLTGKNVLAALAAGFGAALLGPMTLYLLAQSGLPDRFGLGIEVGKGVLESSYLILFPALLALSRRLFKLRGFGRDFWLTVAFMAPLFWVMYATPYLILFMIAHALDGRC